MNENDVSMYPKYSTLLFATRIKTCFKSHCTRIRNETLKIYSYTSQFLLVHLVQPFPSFLRRRCGLWLSGNQPSLRSSQSSYDRLVHIRSWRRRIPAGGESGGRGRYQVQAGVPEDSPGVDDQGD